MNQQPDVPIPAPSRLVAVVGGFVFGAQRLAKDLRREFRVPETPADLQAFNTGFDAGARVDPLSVCPYVREEQAEMWRKGWKAGWVQA